MPPEEPTKYERIAWISSAFTPRTPVSDADLFGGRVTQIMECMSAIFQPGVHIAIYGERGVGKTSLANVLPKMIRSSNRPSLRAERINCNSGHSFAGLMRDVFQRLGQPLDELNDESIQPEEVRQRLSQIPGHTLVILDEFDRVEDGEVDVFLADTIKSLSDHDVPTTIMIVGVADSLLGLLAEHESIVRSLIQVSMPRMSRGEIGSILQKGFERARVGIRPDARERIIQLSEGLPHFTHLIALDAGMTAVANDRSEITCDDVQDAIGTAVDVHSIKSEYQKATQSPRRDHRFEEVLLACAFAPRNELGYFRAGDVREPFSEIIGESMRIAHYSRHLNELISEPRGGTLERTGEQRHYLYRFKNPLLEAYVKIRAVAKGLITEELRAKLQLAQERPEVTVVSPIGPTPPA